MVFILKTLQESSYGKKKEFNLFREDIAFDNCWEEICQVFGYNPENTSQINIEYVRSNNNEK